MGVITWPTMVGDIKIEDYGAVWYGGIIEFLGHLGSPWRIHTAGMFFLLIYHKFKPNVGKYTSPMDPMGWEKRGSEKNRTNRHGNVRVICKLGEFRRWEFQEDGNSSTNLLSVRPYQVPVTQWGEITTPINGRKNTWVSLGSKKSLLIGKISSPFITEPRKKHLVGWAIYKYIGDYTAQLYGEYNKPL